MVYNNITATFHWLTYEDPNQNAHSLGVPGRGTIEEAQAKVPLEAVRNNLLPRGQWLPLEATRQYGTLFADLQVFAKPWTTLVLWSPSVMLLAVMVRPTTAAGCSTLFITLCAFQFILSVVVMWCQPYRSRPHNLLAAATNFCLGFVLVGLHLESKNPTSNTALEFTLTAVQVLLAVISLRVVWVMLQLVLESRLLGQVPLIATNDRHGHWISIQEDRRRAQGLLSVDEMGGGGEYEENGGDGEVELGVVLNPHQMTVLNSRNAAFFPGAHAAAMFADSDLFDLANQQQPVMDHQHQPQVQSPEPASTRREGNQDEAKPSRFTIRVGEDSNSQVSDSGLGAAVIEAHPLLPITKSTTSTTAATTAGGRLLPLSICKPKFRVPLNTIPPAAVERRRPHQTPPPPMNNVMEY
jgi:hypothetical protein